MSELLGYLVLALTAAAFVGSVAAEIHREHNAAVVRDVQRVRTNLMRGFGPTELTHPSALDELRLVVRVVRRKSRHAMCLAMHGKHELYRARSDNRLFQQCLLCGYETAGWTIDRRDRRLHLVGQRQQRKAS